MVKTEILIIGGGVAGLSTAYFLGKSGETSVLVLEQEKDLGGHSSGRNAGMLRQAVPDPILAELAKESCGYFKKLSGNGWKDLKLKQQGSLLLAKGPQVAELGRIARTLSRVGVEARWLSHREAEKKVSILKNGDFSRGLFCPSDATLELAPLLEGFVKSLKKYGIQVLRGWALEDVRKVAGGFLVQAGGKKIFSKKIVNAAGAWAGWVAKKAGAASLPLVPYRRHLFLSPGSQLQDPRFSKWPFVWDVSHDFYFRPAPQGLLLSPCDRAAEKRGDRSEKVDPMMKRLLKKKLSRFSRTLGNLSLGEARSGLRTMAPDGRFIIGEDARCEGFFWVAGLGGHGVTTCFSVGRLAADAILGKKRDNRLMKALSPERFA